MELSKFELAAVKRTAQNVKMLRNKLAKVTEKYNKIVEEKNSLEKEIELWETPIFTKYGFTSEQILSGEADKMLEQPKDTDEMEVPQEGTGFAQEDLPADPFGVSASASTEE